MKRSIRKAIAFSSAVAMMAALALPGTAVENKSMAQCQVALDNTYDATVDWYHDTTVFIKNGSKDAITDKTEMKLVKPDGSVTSMANPDKFDKIYSTLTGPYYRMRRNMSYQHLLASKDGKQVLLNDDGSFACKPVDDNIVTDSDHYMVTEEDGKNVVRKLDSTLVKSYPAQSVNICGDDIWLDETDHGLLVLDGYNLLGLFDKNQKEIDLSAYDGAEYYDKNGGFLEVKSGDHYGMIDDTGKEIVKPLYSSVEPFTYQGNTRFVATKYDSSNKKWMFTVFNKDGSAYINETKGQINVSNLDSHNGYATFCDGTVSMFSDGAVLGIYDFNNKTAKVPAKYTHIYALNNQCFAYQLDGKTGVQTYDGKTLFETDKDVKIQLDNKYIIVETYNKTDGKMSEKADVYSIDGKFLFSSGSYDYVRYYQGMFIVENENGKDSNLSMGLLDDHGQVVVALGTYTSLEPFYALPSSCIFWLVSKDGKQGLLDLCGNVVVELKYQELAPLNVWHSPSQNPLCVKTKLNDKYGLIKITSLISATGLSLDKTDAALKIGDTVTLTPKFTPAGTTDQKVTWSSSDESVATVKDGVVTALKAGEATITATSEDGGYKASCAVKVTETATTPTATGSSTNTAGTTTNTTNDTNATNVPSSSDTNTAASGTAESPATGEASATAALTLLTLSALAVGWAVRKKK